MANRFWVGGTGTWSSSNTANWSTTSGGVGGASVPGASDVAIFNASSGGGTVTPDYNLTVQQITMGAFTGTLDFSANNNNPTMTIFSCTGTGTRTLNMGSGTWTITGNNATVWNMSTITNLTLNAGTSTVNFTYAGATGTRTVIISGANYLNNVNLTGGTDIFSITQIGGNVFNMTGFSGTVSGGGSITFNTLTISPTCTWSHTGVVSYRGTEDGTFTTNGKTLGGLFQASPSGIAGKICTLNGDITATTTLTWISCVLNLAGYTLKGTTMTISGTNTKQITFAGGTIELTSTAASQCWSAASTGTTFDISGGGTIKITGATTNIRTFSGGGMTYPKLYYSNATSAGQLTITGSNTFSEIEIASGTQTLAFTAGTTTTFTGNGIVVPVNNSNNITLKSVTNAVHTLTKTSGLVEVYGMNISYSTATGGATWRSLTTNGNVNNGNNTGWIFTLPSNTGNFLAIL